MPTKIAIIGGGPAGCALARLLTQSDQHKGGQLSVKIYEGEKTLNFRSQGGTLDLHKTTGQACLRAANLHDEFMRLARQDGEALKLSDKNLLHYLNISGSSEKSTTGRPEIDRPQLRKLLFDSLPPDTIVWDHKLTSVTGTHPNLVLHFANGNVATNYDLIIGADGGWSKVRPLLTDTRPFYSGIAGHSFSVPDAANTHPDLHALVNRGSMFAFSDDKSIMAQQMGDGSLNIGTWAVRSSDWQTITTPNYHSTDAKSVKAAYAEEYASWHPQLRALTQVCSDESIVARDLYMLPIGHSWNHLPGVTLIGDAAHLATPFAGEGTNIALEDSMFLAEAILAAVRPVPSEGKESSKVLDGKVKAFEEDMFKRARMMMQMTSDMMGYMFLTPGAPRSSVENWICSAAEGEVGWWAMLGLRPLIWAYFAVFKLIW